MNRKDKSKQLIDELARMSPEIVELAYHEGYNSALARCGHIYKEPSEREVK